MNLLDFQNAVDILQQERLIIYPTETFYALGGNALSSKSVAGVYKAKERDKLSPLPVIIGDLNQLEMVAAEVTQDEEALIEHFWPGPLTILFPARPNLPRMLSGGTGKVAVRLSAHPAATRLSMAAGFPLISSSANISRKPPAESTGALDPQLLEAVNGAVYDEAPFPSGYMPSTIVEVANYRQHGKFLHVLRKGAVPIHAFTELGFACYVKE